MFFLIAQIRIVDFRLFALVIWSVIYNQRVIAHVRVSYIHVACFHTYAVNNSFSAEVDDWNVQLFSKVNSLT